MHFLFTGIPPGPLLAVAEAAEVGLEERLSVSVSVSAPCRTACRKLDYLSLDCPLAFDVLATNPRPSPVLGSFSAPEVHPPSHDGAWKGCSCAVRL